MRKLIALVEPGGEHLTFEQLAQRIHGIGDCVVHAGYGSRDTIALVLPDSAGLIAAFLGVASVSECAVLNPALRAAELDAVLVDADARAIVFDREVAPHVEEVARHRGSSNLHFSQLPAETTGFREPVPHQVALLLHTSATTGKARMVPITHANFQAMAANTRRALGLTGDDRFLSMMPMFHLQGLLSSVTQIIAGGAAVCTPGFDAALFLKWIEEFRPTWYTAGPTLHRSILPLIESQPDILDRAPLRFVRSIGAALPQALHERLERSLHVPLLEGYGMTEAGAITSNSPEPQGRKAGSAGRSTGSEVAILSETGHLLPLEQDGEIVVRGEAVIKAYRNDDEANRSAFRSGWFRTGDLGHLDPEGFLYVTGRIKDIINRGGEKILPGEVENALLMHPAVTEAAVFPVAHSTLGEDVLAAVILREGMRASETELRRFLGETLAHFKVPRRILFPKVIPKGPTGKATRSALAGQLKDEIEAARDSALPSCEAEKKIAGIWQRILSLQNVGAREDFFHLGGDSLGLQLMMTEVDVEFGADDRAEFLAIPTIETLARIVLRSPSRKVEVSWIVKLQPAGERVPFFCVPGADENPYYFMELAKTLGPDQPFLVVRDPRPLGERGVYTLEEHAARFCRAIRAERHGGPYLLGGHCYGGIIAFEAARQLRAAGCEVGVVALFEAPTPGYPKVARQWKSYLRESKTLASRFLRGAGGTDWEPVRNHFRFWRTLWGRRRQAVTRRVLVSTNIRSIVEPEPIQFRNERAGRAYVPGTLDCRVVHFLAADQFHSTVILDDPRLGWRDAVEGEFTICKVPGLALAIFKPPNVKELAAQLDSILAETSRRRFHRLGA